MHRLVAQTLRDTPEGHNPLPLAADAIERCGQLAIAMIVMVNPNLQCVCERESGYSTSDDDDAKLACWRHCRNLVGGRRPSSSEVSNSGDRFLRNRGGEKTGRKSRSEKKEARNIRRRQRDGCTVVSHPKLGPSTKGRQHLDSDHSDVAARHSGSRILSSNKSIPCTKHRYEGFAAYGEA
jgi:hypothetical protein